MNHYEKRPRFLVLVQSVCIAIGTVWFTIVSSSLLHVTLVLNDPLERRRCIRHAGVPLHMEKRDHRTKPKGRSYHKTPPCAKSPVSKSRSVALVQRGMLLHLPRRK